jgi:transposase
MSIVGAFDVHRRQLPFDCADTVTGEVKRGRVVPADREHLRAWLARFAGQDDVHFALEGCTAWRYVVEELAAAGITPHLAEPADTAALRGRKRHAKTDKADARHLRVHLAAGDLPGCWIPPEHVLEARAVVRLYKDLIDERGAWHQRIAATLFPQGVPVIGSMAKPDGRVGVAEVDLSPAGRQAVDTGLRQIDCLTAELEPLRCQLDMISRRQPGCAALRATQFGIGAVTSVAIWAELGDVRRFANSGDVVRHTGLDITVHSSDTRRSAGHLSRQGPQLLRWALYEAAKCAARPAAPDHSCYQATRTGAPPGWLPCRWPASSPAAATTPCASSARRRCSPPRDQPARPRRRAREPDELAASSCHSPAATPRPGQPPKNERPYLPSRGTRSRIMSPESGQNGSAHRDKAGRPARREPANAAPGPPATRRGWHPDALTTPDPLPRRTMVGAGRPGLKVVRPPGADTTLTPRRPAPQSAAIRKRAENQSPQPRNPGSAWS